MLALGQEERSSRFSASFGGWTKTVNRRDVLRAHVRRVERESRAFA